jgi:hypothetical protein
MQLGMYLPNHFLWFVVPDRDRLCHSSGFLGAFLKGIVVFFPLKKIFFPALRLMTNVV